mgnify:CR=1 FL=1
MVERSLAKAEVAGSSPVSRSNFYYGMYAIIEIGLHLRGSKLQRKTIRWIVLPEPGSAAERLRCAERKQSAGEAKSPVSRSNFLEWHVCYNRNWSSFEGLEAPKENNPVFSTAYGAIAKR